MHVYSTSVQTSTLPPHHRDAQNYGRQLLSASMDASALMIHIAVIILNERYCKVQKFCKA